MKRAMIMITCLSMIVSLSACAGMTRQERTTGTGMAVGAGLGAILGQAIGRNTGGTLLGAGIGAIVGGLAGNQVGAYMDRQEQELRNAVAQSEAASIQRENDILVATFKSEVLFDFNSSVIKPAFNQELGRVAGVLNRYPQTTILVEGFADPVGNAEYNQRLSERRAQAVKNALVAYGVDSNRIATMGHGETLPVASENALNRRVTIVIKPIAQG